MQGANLIIECLIKESVTTMFGYPGGSVIPIYDALYDYTDQIKHIRTSHEQGAVHAAQFMRLMDTLELLEKQVYAL